MTTFFLAVKFSWFVSVAVFVSARAQNYLGLNSSPLPVTSREIKTKHPSTLSPSEQRDSHQV